MDRDQLDMPIGSNPLPLEAQAKLSQFIDWIDNNYQIENGSTALYWSLSYQIATLLKQTEKVN